MFLFILYGWITAKKKENSNTSHVFIYRLYEFTNDLFNQYSNTSHVFIYQAFEAWKDGKGTNSNTSHVFIYHSLNAVMPTPSVIQIHPMFLFILAFIIKETGVPLFKYIPCFYLSRSFIVYHLFSYYSNTSHVFIYLSSINFLILVKSNSNTSHVFIYQAYLEFYPKSRGHSNTSHVFIYH